MLITTRDGYWSIHFNPINTWWWREALYLGHVKLSDRCPIQKDK